MNAFNWLASDEDLISIRPKAPEDRRLNVSAAQMRMFFWFALIALPLLIIGAGVSVFSEAEITDEATKLSGGSGSSGCPQRGRVVGEQTSTIRNFHNGGQNREAGQHSCRPASGNRHQEERWICD